MEEFQRHLMCLHAWTVSRRGMSVCDLCGDYPVELGRNERFGDIGIHSGVRDFRYIRIINVGSHGNDRDRLCIGAFKRTQRSGGLKSVHDRHADIHDDGIKETFAAVTEFSETIRTVCGAGDFHVLLFQQHHGDGTLLADGYSCRSQVKRQAGKELLHPLQALLGHLREGEPVVQAAQ